MMDQGKDSFATAGCMPERAFLPWMDLKIPCNKANDAESARKKDPARPLVAVQTSGR